MARRRRRGRIGRALGGVVFLGILGGTFYWGLSYVRSSSGEKSPAPGNLIGTTPSADASPTTRPAVANSPLRPVEPKPTSPAPATPPSLTSRPAAPADLARAQADYQAGVRALQQDKPVEARQALSNALANGLAGSDAADARRKLRELGEKMIFSPARMPDDPLVAAYVVKKSDTVAKIAQAHHISEDLLAQINQLPNKNSIREGRTIKVINGPFHAIVHKHDHELYICLGDAYLCDFRAALGMNGRTPTGKWIVKDHLTNPSWNDPVTGKRWHADDPKNPIGEYWIGLRGLEGEAKDQPGYGIHGTIDEASIGQDVSMGCIRLGAKDIEVVYKLLVPGQSTVVVRD